MVVSTYHKTCKTVTGSNMDVSFPLGKHIFCFLLLIIQEKRNSFTGKIEVFFLALHCFFVFYTTILAIQLQTYLDSYKWRKRDWVTARMRGIWALPQRLKPSSSYKAKWEQCYSAMSGSWVKPTLYRKDIWITDKRFHSEPCYFYPVGSLRIQIWKAKCKQANNEDWQLYPFFHPIMLTRAMKKIFLKEYHERWESIKRWGQRISMHSGPSYHSVTCVSIATCQHLGTYFRNCHYEQIDSGS